MFARERCQEALKTMEDVQAGRRVLCWMCMVDRHRIRGFRRITSHHTMAVHGCDVDAYKVKFPGKPTVAEEWSRAAAERARIQFHDPESGPDRQAAFDKARRRPGTRPKRMRRPRAPDHTQTEAVSTGIAHLREQIAEHGRTVALMLGAQDESSIEAGGNRT